MDTREIGCEDVSYICTFCSSLRKSYFLSQLDDRLDVVSHKYGGYMIAFEFLHRYSFFFKMY